jgi:nicotinamide riboside transporter PnuC
MADRFFSVALLFPALALTIAAWLMWELHDSSASIQTSKWRKIVTTIGLLVLSADVVLSAGYLFYNFSARIAKFPVFDACSSVGAVLCLIGIVAACLGKGLGVRLLIPLGCLCGMFFWYVTIGPQN